MSYFGNNRYTTKIRKMNECGTKTHGKSVSQSEKSQSVTEKSIFHGEAKRWKIGKQEQDDRTARNLGEVER